MEAASRGGDGGRTSMSSKLDGLPVSPGVHEPRKLPEPHPLRVLWRLHYIGTLDEVICQD